MALYGVTNVSAAAPALNAVASTVKTMLQLAAQTTGLRRAFIYEWKVGASAVPNATDCELVWTLIKQTTAGTGGVTLTSNAIDQADAAATSVALGSLTAEPTGPEVGVIDTLASNQRGTYRWVVSPGGPGELVIPATNLAGIGLRVKSSTYTGTVNVGFMYRE
jgi:hypothetical protein